MNKFSIGKLEQARKNPVDFAKELKNGSSADTRFGGYPKSMRWLNALTEFHKAGNLSNALNSLEQGFSNRKPTPKNRRELESLMLALEECTVNLAKKKYYLIKSREPVNIQINSQLRISGIIPLIYMNPHGGFSAYFVSTQNLTWESELKYPIIQHFVSRSVFDTEVSNVEIGYIDYLSGDSVETTYTKEEVDEAKKELEDIGEKIVRSF